MGGTSADMAIVDEHPLLGTESLIGDYPLFMPAVSIDTIGAGGGSIAYRDSQGVLKVGPRSAGAYPGPAAYNRGGTEPTVTDAYLVTGILGEHDLLGGAMEISRAEAEAAIAGLADGLGLTVQAAAEGIIRVATANMYAELLPLIARHGVDYTEFTLMAFGGAGRAHGFMLASEVGIRSVLVPPAPGGMCAVGAALTDLQMDFVASGRWVLDDSAAVKTTFEELGERARAWLAEQGLSEDEARFFRTADMRYTGQSYELTVDMDTGALSANEFHRRYRDVYGYSDRGHTAGGPAAAAARPGAEQGAGAWCPGADEQVSTGAGGTPVGDLSRRDGFGAGVPAGTAAGRRSAAWSRCPAPVRHDHVRHPGLRVLARTGFRQRAGGDARMRDRRLGSVTLEVVRGQLQGIVEEMGELVMRCGHTVFVKETQDFVVAIMTPDGEVAACSQQIGIWIAIGLAFDTVI